MNHSYVDNCIFCKICKKESPADIVYEDDEIMIFKDIKPASKFHYLSIPKCHIENAKELKATDKALVEKLLSKGREVLSANGGDVNDLLLGFHWSPFNSVSHLHLHLISPKSEMGFVGKIIFQPHTLWFVDVDYVFNYIKNKL